MTDLTAMASPVAQMNSLHTGVRSLLARLSTLQIEMCPGLEPNWQEIQTVFTDLAVARSELDGFLEALPLFDGLRADAVKLIDMHYTSWHAAGASVANGIFRFLNIRLEARTDAGRSNWCHPTLVNWVSPTLDLPPDKRCSLGRDARSVVWARAVEDYWSDNTIIPQPESTHGDLVVSGWATLRELDALALEKNLQAELEYATREARSASRPSTEMGPTAEEFRPAWDLIRTLGLKGKQRRAVELLCSGGGRLKFTDIVLDEGMEFHVPSSRKGSPPGEDQLWEDNGGAWNSLQYKLNRKLAEHGWRVSTRDREVHLSRPTDRPRAQRSAGGN